MPIDALSILCAQLMRDLFAIAKFSLFSVRVTDIWNSLPETILKVYN